MAREGPANGHGPVAYAHGLYFLQRHRPPGKRRNSLAWIFHDAWVENAMGLVKRRICPSGLFRDRYDLPLGPAQPGGHRQGVRQVSAEGVAKATSRRKRRRQRSIWPAGEAGHPSSMKYAG